MCVRFLLILFFAIASFGYDELLLDAQSSIVPKIALLDKEISKKLFAGKIVIAVAYDADEADIARDFVAKINGHKSSTYPIKAIAVEFSQLQKTDMSIMYIMHSNDINIKKATNLAKQRGIISFAYDKSDIANGAMLSMYIEKRAVITLKRSTLKESGVQFFEPFYKMVRIVE